MAAPQDKTLAEQRAYYRARAKEYDRWWLRTGRYDHGPETNARWFAEGNEVAQALAAYRPTGHVLELACGTGIWTEQLLKTADRVTAVDSSSEMLELNAERAGRTKVQHIQADIFTWEPPARYDEVFFGFWLSHVPPGLFAEFWRRVDNALKPGGRVYFVDSRREPSSTAHDHQLPAEGAVKQLRRLDNGREFHIYKIFYDCMDLTRKLAQLGWNFELQVTPHYFLHGAGTRAH